MNENALESKYLEGTFPIIKIPKETNYWIIRASGGKYAKDFELNNRITLDSENININQVKSNYDVFRKTFEKHRLKESKHNSNLSMSSQSITISSKKIFNFIHTVKVGDVVLVPTYQSRYFIVGVVTDSARQYSNLSDKNLISKFEGENIPLSKDKFYREVSWINKVPRFKIDSSLLYTLTMHQTLIKLEENTSHVNSLLTPLYIKTDYLNLSLRVNKPENISSEDWEEFYSYLNALKTANEDITVKSNVQSPGNIDLSTLFSSIPNSAFLVILSFFLVGGDIEYGQLHFKINGLLPYAKDKLFKSKGKDNSKTESESNNTSNPDNQFKQDSDCITLNFNELNENQKENLKDMIHTLDLSIDDVQKLAQNTIVNSNQNEHD
ncbi:TPA: hypothetical protein SSA37_001826 [Staphylococcus aureus]|uniref:hypothetical protein n=1 Tax=Staphylococcus aureus TaxID=1280 RepID=UPI0006BB0C6A|nr:hypothetical protein [Staphylococcus aureus]EJX2084601.1 hypothetical protein [Staphylococcus aureus]MDT3874968.1 hypothetical protein [Staphylococcus aureus]MDT3940271.1 hypothetical protein [Staphylococcus aureus]MDT3942874.1 hypothetical protein [Staphylococcus aureus]MDT3965610.1 hypothetical protein [Staphylococcus aureus]